MKVELGGYTSIEDHKPSEAGTFLDATRSDGSIKFNENPKQDDWISIDDIKFTFSASASGDIVPYEAPPRSSVGRFGSFVPRLIKIDDDLKNTVENLLVSIKFNSKLNLTLFVEQEEDDTIHIICRKCGTVGNSISLNKKTDTDNIVLSDENLTGGSDFGECRYNVARAFIPHETGVIKIQTPKSIRGENPVSLNNDTSCAPGNVPVEMYVTSGTLYPIVTCGCDKRLSVLR